MLPKSSKNEALYDCVPNSDAVSITQVKESENKSITTLNADDNPEESNYTIQSGSMEFYNKMLTNGDFKEKLKSRLEENSIFPTDQNYDLVGNHTGATFQQVCIYVCK